MPTSVFDQARHWRVRYPKGRVIYDEGEASSAMFRIDEGCVRLQVNGDDGQRQIVAFLFPGDHFGVCVDERASSAEAVTDVELTRYSLQSVLELSTRSTEVVVKLIRNANGLYRDLAHHVQHVTHLGAADRVLWFLAWLAHREHARDGQPIRLPMSRRDIGDFLGLAPETLSRVFKDLQAEGLLSTSGRRSFALRRPALQLDRPERPVDERAGEATVIE